MFRCMSFVVDQHHPDMGIVTLDTMAQSPQRLPYSHGP